MRKLKIRIPQDRDVLYKVIKYPAGEIQTRLTEAGLAAAKKADSYEIIANPIPDIIELAQLNDALRFHKTFWKRELFLPYLPYARADRRFVEGDCHGLNVFGQLINAMGFTTIWSFDVHNPDAVERAFDTGIANMKPDGGPIDQILPCIKRMRKDGRIKRKDFALIVPDKGASTRYDWEIYHSPLIHCAKLRDPESGKLAGFHVDPIGKNIEAGLIVDDICDGDGTFIGLAEEIRKQRPEIKLGLYVSHGIFSKGLEVMYKSFDYVFSSDYSIHSSFVDTPKAEKF